MVWELTREGTDYRTSLFKDRNFAAATFTMFTLGIVLYGTTVLLPVLLQTLVGYTAQLSGLVLSPGAIVTLITMPLVGAFLVKHDPRRLVVVGLVILAVGMFQLSKLSLYASFGTFVFVWMISRGGLGFLFVPINVMAFSFVPPRKR